MPLIDIVTSFMLHVLAFFSQSMQQENVTAIYCEQ